MSSSKNNIQNDNGEYVDEKSLFEDNIDVFYNEEEDEIKRNFMYNGKRSTMRAVFEGDYVRFANVLKNGMIGEEQILSQEEFEKLVK